jgi:hypothetical protein
MAFGVGINGRLPERHVTPEQKTFPNRPVSSYAARIERRFGQSWHLYLVCRGNAVFAIPAVSRL